MAGEIEVLSESLPQCQFVHHKSHMGLNPDLRTGEPEITVWAMQQLVLPFGQQTYHIMSRFVYAIFKS